MRRNGIAIMAKLIGLVYPLLPWMLVAILLGVLGYLAAISLTILASMALLDLAGNPVFIGFSNALLCLVFAAVFRGVLRYGEQACNHYIAFRLLAQIRHQIFVKLRTLAPAKLQGQDKGNLISMITSDIELLEVFYAHTLSPIAIAVITSGILVVFLGFFHPLAALIALFSYGLVGAGLPLFYAKRGADFGMQVRQGMGKLNSFFLDGLRGLPELIQFNQGKPRLKEFMEQCDALEQQHYQLKKLEGSNRAITDGVVMLMSGLMLICGIFLVSKGVLEPAQVLIMVVTLFSSFGPVVALSSLSNNLHHTLASGERVLALLEEKPILSEIIGKEATQFGKVAVDQVHFKYDEETILEDFSLSIQPGNIVGIHGRSGSGKSTLIRLLMRFWQMKQGVITINNQSIDEINTTDLRKMESYVTQDTVLFNRSLFDNIALAKPQATLQEVKEAARKASIDEFIESLPQGYDTQAGELGDALSGGERQRIGLARAFLHDSDFFLLDEPTSNLDSLNEAVILNALKEEAINKTILLVSHRESTMAITDTVIQMESSRKS